MLQDTIKEVNIPVGTDLNGEKNKNAKTPASQENENLIFLNPTLSALLQKFETVDFRGRIPALGPKESIKQKHIIVIIVDEVLSVARQNSWGLAVQNDFIYVYNGEFWLTLDRNEFKLFLAKAAEKMGYEEIECKYYKFRNELYSQFLSVAYMPPPEGETDKTLINLKNGTLEVTPQGFKLRDFCRNDFLTYQLPFDYKRSARRTRFQQYLNKVQPDPDAQKILSEYVGYVFTRHLKLEKFLLLYGSGANGKSVFFDILNALLGKENISNFSLANLNEEHNRAMIVNKLLNYGSEIRGKIDVDILKQMASGEPIQARLKYGNSFITDRYAKLAFNCNELPAQVEHTEAFFRRFLILPFDVIIPEGERNPALAKEIIANELPGVLNWILGGLEHLLKNKKFSDCKKVKTAINTYRKESDSVLLFLEEEGYRHSVEANTEQSFLFGEYRRFCLDSNYRYVSVRNFRKRLTASGCFCTRKTRGWFVAVEKEGKKNTQQK